METMATMATMETMETMEIARGEWQHFLDDFSKRHEGEIASVQVIGDDIGAQREATAMPFVGISADDAGSAKNSISVMLGFDAEDHFEHLISHPTHLWLKSDKEHVRDVLEIDTADGTKTVVQLEPPNFMA